MNQESGIRNIKNYSGKVRSPGMLHASCFLIRGEGFGLIEIVVAVSIAALLIVGLGQVTQVSLALLREERMNFEAALLVNEGIEALRMLRDASWSRNIAALSTGINYFVSATSTWGVWDTSRPYIRNRYHRTIRLDPAHREIGTDRIIDAGGYDDLGTRKLTATVSWQGRNGTSSVSSVTYLTNFLQN